MLYVGAMESIRQAMKRDGVDPLKFCRPACLLENVMQECEGMAACATNAKNAADDEKEVED